MGDVVCISSLDMSKPTKTATAHNLTHSRRSNTIMHGTIGGVLRRGRPRISWTDNVVEWTIPDILVKVVDRLAWGKTSASSALRSPDDYNSRVTDDDGDTLF